MWRTEAKTPSTGSLSGHVLNLSVVMDSIIFLTLCRAWSDTSLRCYGLAKRGDAQPSVGEDVAKMG
jgi:hypothetical protein